MKDLPLRVRYSLSLAWREGIPAHVMLGIMDYFVVPYALFLDVTIWQVGLIVSLPHLLASFAQLYVRHLAQLSPSRVKVLSLCTRWQAISILFISSIVALPKSLTFPGLLLGVSALRILLGFSSTLWGSLMSDYLPQHIRGQYLGWRAQVVGVAGLAGVGMAGVLLFFLKKHSEAFGFFLIFVLAASCRFLSSRLMAKLYNIKGQTQPHETEFNFFDFVKRFRQSNFVQFVLFSSCVMVVTHIASPYFSVYMLDELNMSYLQYMSIHMSGIVAGLISFPIWGKHGDIAGQARLLKLVSVLVSLVPLLWLFSAHTGYLIVIEFFSGFVWGAFNLCAMAFIFDAVTPSKRVQCLGYFNVINGIGIFTGAMLGSFLVQHLPPLFGSPFCFLFLISGLGRLAVALTMGRRFKEVRTVSHVSYRDLLSSVLGIKPLAGLARGWNFFTEYQKKPSAD